MRASQNCPVSHCPGKSCPLLIRKLTPLLMVPGTMDPNDPGRGKLALIGESPHLGKVGLTSYYKCGKASSTPHLRGAVQVAWSK